MLQNISWPGKVISNPNRRQITIHIFLLDSKIPLPTARGILPSRGVQLGMAVRLQCPLWLSLSWNLTCEHLICEMQSTDSSSKMFAAFPWLIYIYLVIAVSLAVTLVFSLGWQH